jgi:multidrug efflux pump subunit AcrB
LISSESYNAKDKFLDDISHRYANSLQTIISSRWNRLLWIISPVIVLILTFVFLSPQIGFKLFPSGDNALINVSIIAPDGTDDKALEPVVRQMQGIIIDIPELRYAQISIVGNQVDLNYVLLKKDDRYNQ